MLTLFYELNHTLKANTQFPELNGKYYALAK